MWTFFFFHTPKWYHSVLWYLYMKSFIEFTAIFSISTDIFSQPSIIMLIFLLFSFAHHFSHLSAVSHQKDTLMVFMLCSALGPDCSGCTKHLFLFKGCFQRCKMNFLLGGNNVIICVVCLVFGRPGQQSRSLLWPINKVVITSTSLKNWPSNITCQQPENTPQLEQDNKTTSPELFQLLPPDFFNEDKDFCFSSRDPGVCVRVCVCSPGERVKKFWHHRWCKCFCFF